jgi:RNA polymerase sigma-70 factor (ECF subfamily)
VDADRALIERLRAGDEEVFITLVGQHHEAMLRIAMTFVSNLSIAEEVVQDTWLALLTGLDRFDGRSSLRTWMFSVLVNRARTVGTREHRTTTVDDIEATVDASNFSQQGYWTAMPSSWPKDLDYRLTRPELRDLLRELLDTLPERQRRVVTLRDIEGLNSIEVCEVLKLSEGNQRVLLHRGRRKLRGLLDARLKGV